MSKNISIVTYRKSESATGGGGYVVIGGNGQLPDNVATRDWVIDQEYVDAYDLSKRLEEFRAESMELYWSKEEITFVEGYLLYLLDKIKAGYADKAGDAELWAGHHFADYLNQFLLTTSDVKFNSVTATEFESKVKGWIIDALGDAEFRDLLIRSFKSWNFSAGPLGSGVGMVKDDELQTDKLLVRKIMYVLEMMVQRMQFQMGQHVITPGGGFKITRVEEHDTFYRLFFENDEMNIPNYFVVNDQGRIQNFNGRNQKYLWSLVISTGDDYIDLSRLDRDGDGIPAEGDEVVQLGNRDNPDRQDAVLLTSVNGEVGMITYFGINSFDLSGKEGSWFGKHGGKKGAMVRGEFHAEAGSSGLKSFEEFEEMYTINVSSSRGDKFTNGVISTVLKAQVLQYSTDVTDTLAPGLFSWTRTSDNPDGDKVWNLLHEGVGKECVITGEDVYRKAVFSCDVRLDLINN